MSTDDNSWVADIAAHAGTPDLDEARHVGETVMAALGALVPAAHARVIAELPPGLATAFRGAQVRTNPLDELVVPPGTASARAQELIASACAVVAARLSEPTLAWLRGELPPPVARLLVAPSRAVAHHEQVRVERHTLAEGRPGSSHPISEVGGRRE